MTRYFDRRGNALPDINAADWSVEGRRVAFTSLASGVDVSTIHLVIDHSFGDGPPLIFETMIFGGPLDEVTRRYATEAQAKAGHAEMVEWARTTQTAPWAAACATCGWTATAATYTDAGDQGRAHDCPDPDTTVTPAGEDRDDNLGTTVDLDDLPGIDPVAYNARVAADLLFVDPPPLLAVSANPYEISIVGSVAAEIAEWCARHHLSEVDGWELDGTNWRRWRGVIEGVPVRVDCREVPA